MAVLKTSAIKNALKKKGFEEKLSDHYYYILYVDGKKTSVNTKISHSADEISDRLIGEMAKQTHLTKPKFTELVQCTLSGDEYREMMLDAGYVKI